MNSERQWKLESFLFLLAGLMISLSMASLIGQGLQNLNSDGAPATEQTYQNFILSTLGFHAAGLVLVHFFLKMNDLTWTGFLGMNRAGSGKWFLATLGVAVVVLPLALGLNSLCGWLMTLINLYPEEQHAVKLLLETKNWDQYALFGFSAILMAPIVEEILFRGVLFGFLKQRVPTSIAMWLSALIFATAHANLMTFLPLTFFGLVLAWWRVKTQSLLACMLVHALFNTANFLMLVFEWEPF